MEKETKTELLEILDCIRDGIFITDGDANILLLNKASEEVCQYSRDALMNRNVNDLVGEGFFTINEVVSLKCIETGKEETLIQKGLNDEHELLVTGVPLIENGKIKKVIVTERDVSHIARLEDDLRKNRNLAEKYKSELEYYRRKNLEMADSIIQKSKAMEATVSLAARVAKQDITVLIQGESGTGKEVIAKLIYKNSARKDKAFITINCGAIPENLLESELFGYEKGAFSGANEKGKPGLFELANEGTLFLDEVGTMAMHLQVKLLRAIQEREIMRVGGSAYIPIDVRIIAATNENLKEAVNKGEFRGDLYYRLNVVPINIEPLRKRTADIYPLAQMFLDNFNKKYGANKTIDESGWTAMLKYNWPGNVRELENVIERLVVTVEGEGISGLNITAQFTGAEGESEINFKVADGLREKTEAFEKKFISSQMQYYSRTSELSRALGIDKSTLTRKMKRYGIKNIYME